MRLAILCLVSAVTVVCTAQAQKPRIERNGNAWVLDTGVVRKAVRLEGGRLLLVSFRHPASGREYASAAQVSPEFRFTMDGATVSGADAGWTLVEDNVHRLAQGEWQLDLALRRGSIGITKHYVVYPDTPIIREWVTIANEGAKSVRIQEPHFLACNLNAGKAGDLDFQYLTGGGNYNGSQLLKTERMSAAYRRTLDSKIGIQTESYSAYLPLAVVRNRKTNSGTMAGWDYLGHWALTAAASGDLSLKVAGYSKLLAPGARIDTPRAFVGAFTGSLDEMGNALLDWQYRYLWDFTNDDYFARTRWAVDWPSPWVDEGGTPSGDNWGRRLALDLRYLDLARETGTEILWDDAGWYDKWGSWAAPDWRLVNEYAARQGVKWVLWFPTFLASPGSRVAGQHPEWMIPGQSVVEQSLPATAEWQRSLLAEFVKQWGDFQWRYDIAPAVSGNDTDYFESDRNFRWLLERFKSEHKASGVDACYGGGRWISYDIARLAESGEYTDGGVGPYSAYYTSLLVPPDKLHNVVDFDHTYYRPASDRTHLAMNPTWYRDPGNGPDLESIRKDWELYRYLRAQGVVGRWSHVFRPEVANDDPVWYFERVNRDASRGVILTKHARTAPAYFVLAKRVAGGARDRFLGGTWNMCEAGMEDAALSDGGIYQDPVDSEPRYYGTTGELYGPVNFKFRTAEGDRSFVRRIVKPGAAQNRGPAFFGMAIQPGSAPVVITELGLFAQGTAASGVGRNTGTYRLTVVRAADRKVLASAEIDLGTGNPDRLGFKYTKLAAPVTLPPGPGDPVTIRPRGLEADADYDVRCAKAPYRAVRKGADLMANGIALASVQPGELIFLNLPRHPGSGTDRTPPAAVSGVTKRVGTNLGVQGVEVRWQPAADDNWISYYEILRDGVLRAKAAIGAFYFDYSGEPQRLIEARYEVRAVDGDGNRGPAATADPLPGEPETYRALGGFAPEQGHGRWRYEEALEDGAFREMIWEHAGYEGRWRGAGLARIGRIWMQPGAESDAARTFVAPSRCTLSIDGLAYKDPTAEDGTTAAVKVLHNGTQIWPASGWMEVPADPAKRIACRIERVEADAGDAIRFVVRRTGRSTAEPIVWDPAIVVKR